MAGETINIAECARKVSEDIFSYFKWELMPVTDVNFKCHKEDRHKIKKKKKEKTGSFKHTHPADSVFRYFDPYLNKYVYLHTDLKSYSKSSISYTRIRDTLVSLAKTIDCAEGSSEWQGLYGYEHSNYEIRGLLFIYNYDHEYDREFQQHFDKIRLENLEIRKNQILHVIDPARILLLRTIVQDLFYLISKNEFPKSGYSFPYPDLTLHKSHGKEEDRPATIEMLCSPYIVFQFFDFCPADQLTGEKEFVGDGYVIYYCQKGSSELEFVYLFDYLSKFQILSSKASIKIRVVHPEPDPLIKGKFESAKHIYLMDWGNDEARKMNLNRIEFGSPDNILPNYSPGNLAWRVE